jgi:hypothetical protein
MGTGGGKPFSLSALTATGTMGSGFPGGPGGFESSNEGATSNFNNQTFGSGDPNASNSNVTQAAAGIAALEGALQDPFMARVALCGYITLYKEVKPEPVVAATGTQAAPVAVPAGNPAVDPTSTTTEAGGDPGAVPTGAESPNADPGSNPADTTPESTAPATEAVPPGDAKPETPAQPSGTSPAEPPAEPPADPTPAKPAGAAGL